jgi:hypothetical protein
VSTVSVGRHGAYLVRVAGTTAATGWRRPGSGPHRAIWAACAPPYQPMRNAVTVTMRATVDTNKCKREPERTLARSANPSTSPRAFDRAGAHDDAGARRTPDPATSCLLPARGVFEDSGAVAPGHPERTPVPHPATRNRPRQQTAAIDRRLRARATGVMLHLTTRRPCGWDPVRGHGNHRHQACAVRPPAHPTVPSASCRHADGRCWLSGLPRPRWPARSPPADRPTTPTAPGRLVNDQGRFRRLYPRAESRGTRSGP